jgi:hypothetical protein
MGYPRLGEQVGVTFRMPRSNKEVCQNFSILENGQRIEFLLGCRQGVDQIRSSAPS